MKVLFTIETCLDCPYHRVENDEDVSSDSMAAPHYRVVCKKTPIDPSQRFALHGKCSHQCERDAHPVTVFVAKSRLAGMSDIPYWCPLKAQAV